MTFFISWKTAESHFGNILNKLPVADCTEAALYAWHQGLVR